MKLIDVDQGSDKWHEMRKNGIGASDAVVIMGDSPWMTPMQLWEEKQGLGKPRAINSAMSRGTNLEEKARKSYIEMTGIKMSPAVVKDSHYDFMFASLDGISDDNSLILEIKCPGKEDHELAVYGQVPKKYHAQLQHQLAVTGLRMVHYFSFDGENGVIVTVERDNDYIANLIESEREFWECVKSFTPPPLCERDFNKRYDNEWRFACVNWLNAKDNLKLAEKMEESMRQELISASQSMNSIGCGVKLQKIMRAGCVQYSEIPELKDVNLGKYRKSPSESWRITQDE